MDVLQRLVAGEVITRSDSADVLTVYALRNRQLVQTQRVTGGQWVAVVTDYGREAAVTGLLPLELPLPVGRAARKPVPQPEEPTVRRPRGRPKATATEPSEAEAAGEGEAQEARPKGRPRGRPARTDVAREVVKATRAALKGRADDHGLLHANGDGAARVEVSRALIPRAMDFLANLFAAAEEAGVGVAVVKKPYGYHREPVARVCLAYDQVKVEFRLVENTDRTPHEPTKSELAYKARNPWTRLPEWDYHPNGTLTFSFDRDYFAKDRNPRATFNDGVRALLEEKIPDIVREVVARGEQDTTRRLEQERLDAEYEKQREAAVATAAQRYLADLRAQAATDQAAQWQEAVTLRAYAEAMRQRVATDADREWVDHLFAMADRLDPSDRVPPAPELPDSLTEYDLRDYLHGWPNTRPYGWGGASHV